MMSRHQKRLSAPGTYPIERKQNTYVIKGKGPHAADQGLPLVVVLRDVLGYADTVKEVKQILSEGKLLVDGTVRKKPYFTVGFMDVISFPDLGEHYRILLNPRGLILTSVTDADHKLSRVEGKTTLTGGVNQLNLHDGKNIETDDDYATKSSLLLSLPDGDVEAEIPFEEGNLAFVRGGKHAGTVATVTDIAEHVGTNPRIVTLETADGDTFETVEDNVYMVGEDEPEVDIDGAE